jgi:sugar lactone lactonase YvrE
VVAASPQYNGPNTMLADDSHVFWTAYDGVYRVDRAGGAPQKLADVREGLSLATDGNALFVADGTATAVYAVTAPGVSRAIYTGSGGADAHDVAWDGAHVYVAGHAGVIRMNADGSAQTNLSAGVTTQFETPYRLAVDDTRVYFSIFDESKIISVCK